jgi:ATP-binding cassette, subfamily B, bacterial PglK
MPGRTTVRARLSEKHGEHVRGQRAGRDETVRKVRYLLREERPWRWLLVVALAILVTIVEAGGAVAVFVLLGLVAAPDASLEVPFLGDLQTIQGDVPREDFIVWLAIGVGVYFVLRGLVILAQLYAQDRLAQNAGARLSTRLLAAYLRMPYVLHVRRNSAELIRNAYDSVRALTNELLMPAVRLIASAAMAVGLLAVLFLAAPLATGLALVVLLPLVLLLLHNIQPRLKRLGKRRQLVLRESLQVLQQALHGIREVILFGRGDYFYRAFRSRQRTLARVTYVNRVLQEVPRTLLETGLVAFIAAFFVVSITIQQTPEEVLAVLGLFAYVALRLQPSVQKIVQSLNSIRFAGEAIANIYDDLYLVESSVAASSPAATHRSGELGPGQIELAGVGFRYTMDAPLALRDIHLRIEPGESVGVVGPTGGGKSTLIDVLTGLLEPTEGAVRIDGQDLRTCTTAWQRRLGVVPQTVFLVDDSLRRNIALGYPDDQIDDEQVLKAIAMAQLTEFAESLPDKLDTMVGERGIRLSGGQRQRVAIARALYRDPEVVIFDEGTSALDNITESELLDALRNLRGERTIIAVAHRLTSVRECDRIVVLDKGRIADIGTYQELLDRNAQFRRMSGRSSA